MPETSPQRQLTQLNFEIEQAQAEAARLDMEQKALAKDVAQAARRLRYLHFVRWFRRPAAAFEFWPIAAMILGPGVVGVLLFILTHVISGAFPLALLLFIVGLGAGGAVFAALLYRPANTLLESAIADALARRRLENARSAEKSLRLREVNERLQRLIDERRDKIATGKLQRAALLQRDWKSMKEAEWEDFVVEACRTLGATVERTSKVGPDDPNLVVDFGNRRVAVFTQGEGHNVASGTIQQALAAKDRHRCQACAVIINRRFTGAAQDFAQHNGCSAIGASEFPDFVLGKIEL
ncbi:MAG: restriction endonuclease [Pirellulales bacterium]